jgi:hypothetical protein
MKEIEAGHFTVDIEEKKELVPISNPSFAPFKLNEDNAYKSCCCGGNRITDRRLLTFISQFSFSLITVMFCMYKLGSSSENSSVYLPILSGIISIWIPAPSLPRK